MTILLDGAMSTMVRDVNVKYCDILSATKPDIIRNIHRQYLEAGADIISSNTFNCNSISLASWSDEQIYDLALKSVKLAREEADRFSALTCGKPRFVAGVLGQAPLINQHKAKERGCAPDYDEVYKPAIEAIIDGGADIFMLETIYDFEYALWSTQTFEKVKAEKASKTPLWISASPNHEETKTAESWVNEYLEFAKKVNPLIIGLNCCSSTSLYPYIDLISKRSSCLVSCHPNAGFPDVHNNYTETPASFASKIMPLLDEGRINIIGGCCGTTPKFIEALSQIVRS